MCFVCKLALGFIGEVYMAESRRTGCEPPRKTTGNGKMLTFTSWLVHSYGLVHDLHFFVKLDVYKEIFFFVM